MDEENDIVGIRVANPTPGEDYGFQHLVEIGFNEDDLQDQQKVYTYNIGETTDVRMLTPGSIILIENEEGSFDHNSAAYKSTHYGAPVLNEDGLLVGICYNNSGDQAAGYYSAYNAQSIADKIERNQGRNFTSIAVALQHLRQ
ncbi:uncharacterized protein [Miscanthus floridulus]|uniref:uncharacterized protein n=1 Tax=Miscanthus floridulus TaxID=154761 RepID=UPI003458A5F1